MVKENNPNRPVAKLSNRPLIPDSVRKKKTQKETPQEKKVQTEDNGSDDNDSDDGGSFFLLSESNTSSLQDASTIQVPSGSLLKFSIPFPIYTTSPYIFSYLYAQILVWLW